MEEIKNDKREIFVCDCNSLEHQYGIWWDEDDNEVWIEPHLNPTYSWFRRLWGAIKYIFGYKTRYGNWDSIIIKPEDLPRLREYFDKAIKINKERNNENQEKEHNI